MNQLDQYLQGVTPTQRKELEKIRATVKRLIPDVEETMGYGIPTFKYKGRNLFHFAAFKDHMSVFPGPGPIEALGQKLKNYKLSKGTVQFTEDNLLPEPLIAELVTLGKAEIDSKK